MKSKRLKACLLFIHVIPHTPFHFISMKKGHNLVYSSKLPSKEIKETTLERIRKKVTEDSTAFPYLPSPINPLKEPFHCVGGGSKTFDFDPPFSPHFRKLSK